MSVLPQLSDPHFGTEQPAVAAALAPLVAAQQGMSSFLCQQILFHLRRLAARVGCVAQVGRQLTLQRPFHQSLGQL